MWQELIDLIWFQVDGIGQAYARTVADYSEVLFASGRNEEGQQMLARGMAIAAVLQSHPFDHYERALDARRKSTKAPPKT